MSSLFLGVVAAVLGLICYLVSLYQFREAKKMHDRAEAAYSEYQRLIDEMTLDESR